jgi:hypothetical protein
MHAIKTSLIVFLLLLPLAGQAGTFECTIRDVLTLSQNGSMATHGWAANYRNRKFFLDRDSGKVTGTTALKVRLSNYNADHRPEVLDRDVYVSLTLFRDSGRYAVIQIETPADDGGEMPFFYRTAIGMFLTGTCIPKT